MGLDTPEDYRRYDLWLAKEAYKAYSLETGNKNYQGLPMPEFEDLPEKIQNAWIAASKAAVVAAMEN